MLNPPQKPKNTRSTAAETRERVNTVYSLILAGASRKQIVEYGQKQWNVSAAAIDGYTAKARQMFEEQSKFAVAERFGRALARLDELYKNAFHVKDYNLCRQIVRDEAALLGIGAPKRVDAKIAVEGRVTFTDLLHEVEDGHEGDGEN